MNNIAIKLGFINIYWYSLILLIAFITGALLAIKEAQKQNINKEIIIDYFFYLVPLSLLGARIYYVIFNFKIYSEDIFGIFRVWEGGLAIHGGIIAGMIFTYIYTKKNNIKLFKFTDIVVVSLIIGQAIGRWGNFINQEAYGPMISLEKLQSFHIPNFIINGMNINGIYYQPTFLYESIWCLLGFILLCLIRKYKKYKAGELTAYYAIWYGIGRFMIETMRQDSLMLLNFKVAKIASILMILIGVIIYIYTLKRESI